MSKAPPLISARRMRLGLKGVAAVIALAVVGACLAAWIAMHYAASGALGRAERAADLSDPKWRMGDLLAGRAVVPDEANSALVVKHALARMPAMWPPVARRRPAGPDAPPGSPRLVQEGVMERLAKVPPQEKLDVALASDLRRNLATYAESRAIARSLADMGEGRTDPKLNRFLIATLLGHIQNTRNVAMLLDADASLRTHDGDVDGALDSCRAILGVGRSIGDEFFAISQLVRMAHDGRAVTAAERVLAQGQASDAALARLQAQALHEASQPLLLWGTRGERATMDDVFHKLATGEVSPAELSGGGMTQPQSPGEILATASGAFVRYNHALVLDSLNDAISIAKRPPADQPRLWEAWEQRHKLPDAMLPRLAGSLGAETMPALASIAQASLRNIGRLNALAAALAAERHRLRHGAFPASLADIDRDLLPSPPIDPYSGRPIRLRPIDGGLAIYSVGRDRADDGGDLDPRQRDNLGTDSGVRLFAPSARARPPARALLPEDVFQRLPGDEETDDASP